MRFCFLSCSGDAELAAGGSGGGNGRRCLGDCLHIGARCRERFRFLPVCRAASSQSLDLHRLRRSRLLRTICQRPVSALRSAFDPSVIVLADLDVNCTTVASPDCSSGRRCGCSLRWMRRCSQQSARLLRRSSRTRKGSAHRSSLFAALVVAHGCGFAELSVLWRLGWQEATRCAADAVAEPACCQP